MAGLTNKFKYQVLNWVFEGQEANVPATFFIPLYTSTTAPNPDHNVIGDMEEAPAGNGYTAGGVEVTAATDFDSLTEDDSGDKATVRRRYLDGIRRYNPRLWRRSFLCRAYRCQCYHREQGALRYVVTWLGQNCI